MRVLSGLIDFSWYTLNVSRAIHLSSRQWEYSFNQELYTTQTHIWKLVHCSYRIVGLLLVPLIQSLNGKFENLLIMEYLVVRFALLGLFSMANCLEQRVCNVSTTITVRGNCVPCYARLSIYPRCPRGTLPFGNLEITDCNHSLYYMRGAQGCQYMCQRSSYMDDCCPGYWGPNCDGK